MGSYVEQAHSQTFRNRPDKICNRHSLLQSAKNDAKNEWNLILHVLFLPRAYYLTTWHKLKIAEAASPFVRKI